MAQAHPRPLSLTCSLVLLGEIWVSTREMLAGHSGKKM